MGPAPVTPEIPRMGVLSRLPAQTPTVNSAVNPRHQLSRKSVDVPVLTAQGKGSLRGEWEPKAAMRAALLLMVWASIQQAWLLSSVSVGVVRDDLGKKVMG